LTQSQVTEVKYIFNCLAEQSLSVAEVLSSICSANMSVSDSGQKLLGL